MMVWGSADRRQDVLCHAGSRRAGRHGAGLHRSDGDGRSGDPTVRGSLAGETAPPRERKSRMQFRALHEPNPFARDFAEVHLEAIRRLRSSKALLSVGCVCFSARLK